jgi:hypothetical protein
MGLASGDSKEEEAGEGPAGAERRGKEKMKKKGMDKKRNKTKSERGRRGSEGVTADAAQTASGGGKDLGVGEVRRGGGVAGGLIEEPLPLAGEKDFVKPPSIFDVHDEGLTVGLLGSQEVSGSEVVARDARPGKLGAKFNGVGHMAKEMAGVMACEEGGRERGVIRNESPKGLPVGMGRRGGHMAGDKKPADSPVKQERRKKKHKKKDRSS